MGIVKDPKYFELNIDLKGTITIAANNLLQEFTNVFAWNYKKLRRIPPHITEYKIELETTIPPSH